MAQLHFEVCVDSVESALAAQAGGAYRIELCAALGEGGLTPSVGLLEVVRAKLTIPIAAMIRPRAGDFCYSSDEVDVMRRDLLALKERGANMVVLGLLKRDGTVDEERTRELVELAKPLPVTFHRAFDLARDPFAALEALIQLGCQRVLTSGQEKSVLEGLDVICQLVERAGDRIIVVPGGGVTERNLSRILRESGVRELHVSASGSRESLMEFRNTRVPMGRTLAPSEYALSIADEARVRRFCNLANSSGA